MAHFLSKKYFVLPLGVIQCYNTSQIMLRGGKKKKSTIFMLVLHNSCIPCLTRPSKNSKYFTRKFIYYLPVSD